MVGDVVLGLAAGGGSGQQWGDGRWELEGGRWNVGMWETGVWKREGNKRKTPGSLTSLSLSLSPSLSRILHKGWTEVVTLGDRTSRLQGCQLHA